MHGEIRSYRDLIAWQKGMDLCRKVYAAPQNSPERERFGLTAQLRRTAVSVPSNIAEGYGRRRQQEYVRFLEMGLGSLCEAETQILLAKDLGFGNAVALDECLGLAQETGRVLYGLAESIKRAKH